MGCHYIPAHIGGDSLTQPVPARRRPLPLLSSSTSSAQHRVSSPASSASLLSEKHIPTRERLIVPLDVATEAEAKAVVTELGDSVTFYKIGLQLLMSGRYFQLLAWLREQDKQVFADIKFFDVPRTVASAVEQLRGLGVRFATVHGNDEILKAACAVKHDVQILAVTVLTSLDAKDMESLGFHTDLHALVLSRARRAQALGCDGVISSGLEARALRDTLGANFLVIVPGVRPGLNVEDDDQKRIVNIEQAFHNGADYIVVGRPILEAPNRRAAADDIQLRIRALFP